MVQILMLALFLEEFTNIVRWVVSGTPVDSETPMMTSRILDNEDCCRVLSPAEVIIGV
jgi:hypothetical protein